MNLLPHYLRVYGAETEPAAEECRRLYLAVRSNRTSAEVAQSLLGTLADPEEADVHRLVVGSTAPRRPGPRLRHGRVAAAAALAAASALVTVGGLAVTSHQAAPIVELRSPTHWTTASPSPGVELELKGVGDVSASARRPRVRWASGELRVEVDPDAEVDFVVETREARARVVGTVFTIDRDLLGTHVEVSRGKVETTCQRNGEIVLLAAGERMTCLPIDAAGMLARARFLQDQGAPWSDVLSSANRGLADAAGQPSLQSELRVIRITALVELGRDADALEEARAYLASGVAIRKDEVEDLVERLTDGEGEPR